MLKDSYLHSIIGNLGIALNPENNKEIIIKSNITFNKYSKKYELSDEYSIFYQGYGTIIVDFLNTKFNDRVEFNNFFNRYSLFSLENKKILKLFKDGYCSEEDYNVFIYKMFNKYKKTLISYQKDISNTLAFCLTKPKSDMLSLSPFERLCVLEYLPNTSIVLHSNIINTIHLNTLSNINTSGFLPKELSHKLLNKEIIAYSNTLYIPSDIASLLKFELTEIIKGNIFLKTCKYCNNYFIASNNTIAYCSNIAPGYTAKTCKQIGRNRIALEKKKQDEALSLYTKVYNSKAYKATRYKDMPNYLIEYKQFQKIGRKKVEFYKKGQISKEDFIDWINRNK